MSSFSNKFVSQSEVDEKRRKRQEEWEQKRKPDDPLGKFILYNIISKF